MVIHYFATEIAQGNRIADADNLAERRLGTFGICLVLCGFVLQSVQYWTVILDVPMQ